MSTHIIKGEQARLFPIIPDTCSRPLFRFIDELEKVVTHFYVQAGQSLNLGQHPHRRSKKKLSQTNSKNMLNLTR